MKKIITAGFVLLFLLTTLTAQEKTIRTKKSAGKPVPVEVPEGTPVPVPDDKQLSVEPHKEVSGDANDLIPAINDVDGNTYTTTILGNQIWMSENLKTTRFNDGSSITEVKDNSSWILLKDPAFCWYGNNFTSKEFYGALYNWHTINTGKLCPSGWHIPSDDEWTELELFLQNSGFNYDGTVDADLDRETKNKTAKALASASNWAESAIKGSVGNTDYELVRNRTDFKALPAGCRKPEDGSFDGVTTSGFWWSSTGNDAGKAWIRNISENESAVSRNHSGKAGGYSVRCIMDQVP